VLTNFEFVHAPPISNGGRAEGYLRVRARSP
jgi:hypothetical protein